MKRFPGFLVFILVFALAAAQLPCPAAAQEPDDCILRLSEDAELSGLGFPLRMIGENVCVASAAQTAELLRLGVVECIAQDDVLTIQVGYSAKDWNHVQIGTEYAWNHPGSDGGSDCRGDGVIVAVIDSGVYPHSDFNAANFLPVDGEYEGYTQWHGTFVTGIIAAQLNGAYTDGVAPNVKILPLCITDHAGNTSTAQAIAAINYAVEQGADVINLSIGGKSRNRLLEEACQAAVDAGVIVVACVGNAGSAADADVPRYPAAFDCVISVSACSEGENGVEFADFSCHNDMVDACAPGGGITSLYVDGDVARRDGTSFASPVVTAMAAIAKQHDPAIGSAGFLALLEESCTDLGAAGKDEYFGYGLVDIPRFIGALCPDEAATPPEEEQPYEPEEEEPLPEEEEPSEPEGPAVPDREADTAPEEVPSPVTAENPFEDVVSGTYYYDAVQWAVRSGITAGTDPAHFSPDAGCTRAELVTFLYRAAGSPGTTSDAAPFSDVESGSYYADAVSWAYENGITKGVSETEFGGSTPVTREQVVTFLWRFAGSMGWNTDCPEDAGILRYGDFVEVQQYAADAFRWAVANGIAAGTSSTTLSPHASCLRGQIVTFLWRLAAQRGTE